MGQLEILNVTGGDVKVTFDKDIPGDLRRAQIMLTDMIHRGFAILLEIDGRYQRVTSFDPERNEYIIKVLSEELESEDDEKQAQEERPKKKSPRRDWPTTKRVPVQSGNAVVIARTAGG